MTTKLNPASLQVDWVGEDEKFLGNGYMKEVYGKAAAYDVQQFRFWKTYLCNLAISAFTWENMPAGIDARAVEYILLYYGQGAFFTENGGMLFAQAAPSDNINMYYNPNQIILQAPSGQVWQRHCNYHVDGEGELQPRDAVMCFDSMMRVPMIIQIRNYARRLAEIDRVIDLNVSAQKTPWIISGPEEAKGTKKDLVRKLAANEQFISINDAMGDFVNYEVLNTQAPYVADKLQDLKKRILDEAVTFCGADNANTDKRERVNAQEVLSNNEQIMLMRNSRLSQRRECCELVNTVFADYLYEPISVKWSVPHLRETEEPVTLPTEDLGEGEPTDADI